MSDTCGQCGKKFGEDQCADFALCWPCVRSNQERIDSGLIDVDKPSDGSARYDGKKIGPLTTKEAK